VLAATHDARFVAAFARRVVRLDGGRIVADGPAGGEAADAGDPPTTSRGLPRGAGPQAEAGDTGA
jgi:energy-coupling factor transporter ATP-binding protein EcfA2